MKTVLEATKYAEKEAQKIGKMMSQRDRLSLQSKILAKAIKEHNINVMI